MKKFAFMMAVVLVAMVAITSTATAGVGGADPDRFGGGSRKSSLQTNPIRVGAVAARATYLPGVGGAEPEGVGGARPEGVGGARPYAREATNRFSLLPEWLLESLLRNAWRR